MGYNKKIIAHISPFQRVKMQATGLIQKNKNIPKTI